MGDCWRYPNTSVKNRLDKCGEFRPREEPKVHPSDYQTESAEVSVPVDPASEPETITIKLTEEEYARYEHIAELSAQPIEDVLAVVLAIGESALDTMTKNQNPADPKLVVDEVLRKENERLSKEMQDFYASNEKLRAKNERLEQQLNRLDSQTQQSVIIKLRKENKRLREENKRLRAELELWR